MPFCEDCAKYWAPSAMSTDGTCPTCQRVLEAPQIASTVPTHRKVTAETINLRQLAQGLDDDDDAKAPWHFKLLVVALCGYLGWRIIQIFV
jgi:hypothetical protein